MKDGNWHNLSAAETIESLGANRQGLTGEDAQRRLSQFGPNELQEKKKAAPWKIYLEQFKGFLIIILLVAIALTIIVGEYVDAVVITVIVLFVTILGFIQEYRAERAMEALKEIAAPTASVIRDGEEVDIPSRELVPGDVILLRSGDRVPADSRLIESANLRADEASLTGESVPVEKIVDAIPGEPPVGDRRNMAYMGTAVAYGRGTAMVVATGMSTEFGKIAGMLQAVEEKQTPLQENLDRVGKWLGIACLSVCAIVAVLGIFRGHGVLEMIIWGISLAVAAVPEALPAIVTISLAIGASRMVKRNALVRRLAAVETLGSTMVICSDKTGTLTQDEMTVRRVYVNNQIIDVTGVGYEPKGEFYLNGADFNQQDIHLQTLLRINTLCTDTRLSSIDGLWHIKGDPTEGALVVAAAKGGIWQDETTRQFPRIDEVPFSSERKMMTTIHTTPQGRLAYSKGAPETILDSCTHIFRDGREDKLSDKDREQVLEVAKQMAEDALRVLGMAYKPLPDVIESTEAVEREMVFAGLAGMIDPPREEAREAIQLCGQAGIKSVMITGDHKLTAMAVAEELGLLRTGIALSGSDLDELSDEEFENLVEGVEVYARVSPAHKMRVVDAFSKKGLVVAMTGDGVNDAPALKKADIGVAMGKTGTDVSKEAAAMILIDDNFASIVSAVEEGRGIFGNIKKYLMYLLSCNIGEILLMLVAILAGLPLPLVAVQILYVNLATDGLPALALSVDPPDPDIMKQPPRGRREGIFTKPVIRFLGGAGLWTGLVTLGVFIWALNSGRSLIESQAMCFVTLVLVEFFNAFNSRSEKKSLFKIGPFRNRWLLLALAWECTMLVLVIYVPFLQRALHTFALSAQDWVIAILSASTIFIAVEIAKLIISWREKITQGDTKVDLY
jgi:Ca2+-transporting ATPase